MIKAPFSVSIVMPNYNYEKYVGAAIDSALALEWPNFEVIVIDDGSTDGSRDIIKSYGDRITVVFQENSGQVVACNKGFEKSRGDVIIFLDSDDLLRPSIIREIAGVWRPGISKVQFLMQTIDADGKPTGALFPQFSVTPTVERIRNWYLGTGTYPTPPGSGNAYSRQFLSTIFPLDNSCGTASDSQPLAAAPLLGDVVTILQPLVCYRVHGKNQGAMLTIDVTRFGREVTRARQRFSYAQGIAARSGMVLPDYALDRGLGYLQYRLPSLKLAPEIHPVPNDTIARVMNDFFRGTLTRQGYGYIGKIMLFIWAVAVVISPASIALHLVEWRFSPTTRPQFMRKFLTMLQVIR